MISLPKTCKLPNAGCHLYVSVDYTLVFMVNIITRWHSQWLQLSFRSALNTILWYHVNLFSTFVMFSKCISISVVMNYQLDQIHELSTLINHVSSFSS